ncbi:hypothetical protein [Bdellovibrio sp. HCB-162]|uniref:hypothetical protein n=1 Tax=Bdellovibrio sp. HCB-162 TaxID=3394234 RepID=UPI0039BD14C1
MTDEKLIGRQDPIPEVPLKEKEEYLTLIEEFLGRQWLAKDNYGPFQQLWNRRDVLSTIELLSFGSALKTFKGKVTEGIYRKAANEIKSKDQGNSAAKIFEIVSSSMFENESQRIEIPKENNPGYDFLVNLKNGSKIRFSVKALLDSKHANEFKSFSQELNRDLPQMLNDHYSIFLIQQDFNITNKYSHSILKRGLREIIMKRSFGVPFVSQNNWILRLDKMEPMIGENFYNQKPSYTLLTLCPHQKNEQSRFYSKIQDACDNLKKHCSDVDNSSTNGIIIKVPDSIAISDATKWLNEFWDQQHDCISIVIIMRASYTSSDDLSQSWLTYEFSQVSNPKSKVQISELAPETLTVQVPIGKVSTSETKAIIHVYDKEVTLSGSYWYFSGRHIYQKPMELQNGNVTFNFKRLPNVHVSCVFTGFPDGDLEMSARFPPSEDLLIL